MDRHHCDRHESRSRSTGTTACGTCRSTDGGDHRALSFTGPGCAEAGALLLATLTGRVKVVEFDAESADGEKRINSTGLKGHVPMLLLINGSDRFKRADGTTVEFKDFPAKAGNPLGLNGSWTVDDFKAAVNAAVGTAAK